MLKINKAHEPDFFLSFKKKQKPRTWDEIDKKLKDRLKKYISEKEQKPNNATICVYCERSITESDSHIEHIKPRSKFPREIFSYINLAVSCNERKTGGNHKERSKFPRKIFSYVNLAVSHNETKTCGSHKDENWEDRFINPVKDNPEDFFEYLANGEIVPIKKDDESAIYNRSVKFKF